MPKSANLEIKVDGEVGRIVLLAAPDLWAIHAVGASESAFRWSTLDAVRAWIDAEPGTFVFQAFPDDLSTVEEPGRACAVVVGTLPGSMFFGYQGIESFWGGVATHGDVVRILDTADRLRGEL